MENLERLFKPHILDRGYEYFLEERVVDIHVQDDLIQAAVAGTDDYEVVIEGIKYDFPRFYCDCPYADVDKYCKHMAAVLYEYEDGKNEDQWQDIQVASKKIEQLVSNAEEQVVRDFLIDLLKKDKNLVQRFTRLTSPEITEKVVQQLKHRIDKIVLRHAGDENYIEYDKIEKFVNDLISFIDDEIVSLVDKKANLAAFHLTNYILLEVEQVDIDDLEGELYEVSAECRYVWEAILEKATIQEKETMFTWFKNQLKHSNYGLSYSEIEQICEEYF